MIKNILAFIFAAVLIDFDRRVIDGYNLGYWSSFVFGNCNNGANIMNNLGNIINNGGNTIYNGINFWDSNTSSDTIVSLRGILLAVTKGQLAGSVVILVSSLTFVGIYIYVYIKAIIDDNRG